MHGIDDIRALSDQRDVPIDMYGPPDTMERLVNRFAYIFDDSIQSAAGNEQTRRTCSPDSGREDISDRQTWT